MTGESAVRAGTDDGLADVRTCVGRWVGLLLVVQAEPVAAAVPSPCGKGRGWHCAVGFVAPYNRFRDAERAARCGPACLVAWEGPG
jgi:hypothetical protein